MDAKNLHLMTLMLAVFLIAAGMAFAATDPVKPGRCISATPTSSPAPGSCGYIGGTCLGITGCTPLAPGSTEGGCIIIPGECEPGLLPVCIGTEEYSPFSEFCGGDYNLCTYPNPSDKTYRMRNWSECTYFQAPSYAPVTPCAWAGMECMPTPASPLEECSDIYNGTACKMMGCSWTDGAVECDASDEWCWCDGTLAKSCYDLDYSECTLVSVGIGGTCTVNVNDDIPSDSLLNRRGACVPRSGTCDENEIMCDPSLDDPLDAYDEYDYCVSMRAGACGTPQDWSYYAEAGSDDCFTQGTTPTICEASGAAAICAFPTYTTPRAALCDWVGAACSGTPDSCPDIADGISCSMIAGCRWCFDSGIECSTDYECCSGECDLGACTELCKNVGVACTDTIECCSGMFCDIAGTGNCELPVNHPPDKPLAPHIDPSSLTVTETITCTLNCPPSPMTLDPDIGDIVSVDYQWERNGVTGAWIGGSSFDCASSSCTVGETIRLRSRACDDGTPVLCTVSDPSNPATVVPTVVPPDAGEGLNPIYVMLALLAAFSVLALAYMATYIFDKM